MPRMMTFYEFEYVITPGRNSGYHIHYADSVSVNLMPDSQTNQNYGSNEVSPPDKGRPALLP